jgi:hypothetical protein
MKEIQEVVEMKRKIKENTILTCKLIHHGICPFLSGILEFIFQ